MTIEKLISRNYDENLFYYNFKDYFLILYYQYCNGLTILKNKFIIMLMAVLRRRFCLMIFCHSCSDYKIIKRPTILTIYNISKTCAQNLKQNPTLPFLVHPYWISKCFFNRRWPVSICRSLLQFFKER